MANDRLGANFSIDITNLRAGLKEANQLIRESQSEFKAAAAGMDDWTQSEEGLSAKLKSLTSTADAQRAKVEALKQEYKRLVDNGLDPASTEASKLRTQINNEEAALAKTEKEIKNNTEALDNLGKETDGAADAAEKASNGGFTVMKGVLANLATDVIRNCISALKDFAKEAITVGMTFDSSMSQVGAVSGATGEELDKLRDKAKEMGSTTKFTASEAADAFNYMAMAGWKTEDMLGGIDGILNLAAASGSDLATTSDIVTDALTAMGYAASDAGRLADVMAAASSNANTNVEMMGMTFQYAAPIVGALGYNMEDAAVAIGLMANAGIKGEKSGTALRSILTRLSAPPKEAADAMEELGISITDSSGKMKPLSDVMDDLRNAFDGLSETEQTAAAKHIAGAEAMSGLLAIANAAPADFEKLTKAVENSSGAAEKMSTTMLDNLGGDITILKSGFEGLQLTLYETANGAMRDVVQEVTNGIIPAITDLINGVEGADVALGESISKILNSIISTIIEFLPEIINVAGTIIFQLAIGLVNALPQLVTAISTIVSNLLIMIGEQLPNIVTAVIAVIPLLVESLLHAYPQIYEAACKMLISIVEAIPMIIDQLVETLPELISTIIITLIENFPVLMKAGIELFSAIIKAIPEIIPKLITATPQIIKAIFEALTSKEAIDSIKQAGKDLIEGLWNGIKDMAGWIKEKIAGFGDSVLGALKDFFGIKSPSRLMRDQVGKNLALGIGEGFTKNIGKVNDEITDAMNFDDPKFNISGTYSGRGNAYGDGKQIVVNQYNNYSQAHSRYEIYKSKQQTAAAVRLAMAGA